MQIKQLSYTEWKHLHETELLQEFIATLPSPNDLNLAKSCTECDGEGELECNLYHMHECEECGGTGTMLENSCNDYIQDAYNRQKATDLKRLKEYELCLSQN